MSITKRINFDNAQSFIAYLRLSNDHWNEEYVHSENVIGRDRWVFRGHWDSEEWLLSPKAWRPNGLVEADVRRQIEVSKNRTPQIAPSSSLSATYWKHSERRVLIEFAKAIDSHHLPIKSEYLRESSYPTNRDVALDNVAEIACLAQHHGLPTRLLDWTLSPLVAAFWACDPDSRNETSKQLCVWALNRTSFEVTPSITLGRIKFHDVSTSTSDYLRVQAGLFSEILAAESYFAEHGSWPDIDSFLASSDPQPGAPPPVLRKLTLPTAEAERLLVLLERENISKSYLMPSLDNIAQNVVDKFSKASHVG